MDRFLLATTGNGYKTNKDSDFMKKQEMVRLNRSKILRYFLENTVFRSQYKRLEADASYGAWVMKMSTAALGVCKRNCAVKDIDNNQHFSLTSELNFDQLISEAFNSRSNDLSYEKRFADELEQASNELAELCSESCKLSSLAKVKQLMETADLQRQNIADLEREKLKLFKAVQTELQQYLDVLDRLLKTSLEKDDFLSTTSTVERLSALTKGTLLKLDHSTLLITAETYSENVIKALELAKHRLDVKLATLNEELTAKRYLLDAYKRIESPEYQNILREYLRVLSEIESFEWGIKEYWQRQTTDAPKELTK